MRSKRDAVAAIFLFLSTAAFVLWQDSKIAVLWDLSYLLDTSWRIALGQMPYRDFLLVHAPLTFLIQAAIMRVAGRHYWLQIAYVALAGSLATVLTWRIVFGILRPTVRFAWAISLILAAPLVFLGIYSIYPHPIYDGDCALAILAALWMLQCLSTRDSSAAAGSARWIWPVLTGAVVVLPVFFKQNMGLPFLFAVLGGISLLLVSTWAATRRAIPSTEKIAPPWIAFLAGIVISLLIAVALIQITAGLGNYIHWTVQFAAQRRLPGFTTALSAYRDPVLLWTLPCACTGLLLIYLPLGRRLWAQALAFCLFAAPFAGAFVFLLNDDDPGDRADNLLSLWPMLLLTTAVVALLELRKGITVPRLMPFFVLAAIQGTFLSQSVNGSTYAIWPLLIILIAGAIVAIPLTAQWLAPALAATISITFLICGGLYAISHDRMDYIDIPDQPIAHATLQPLIGMADRGPYLPEFEELIRFAEHEIPAQDGLLAFPGEDPFYFATGRVPQFPVLLFDPATDPYSAKSLLAEARKRNIRWVIVKTHRQSNEDVMPQKAETVALMQKEFHLYKQLTAYDIYRR
jgi:hypothetical protein